jgi:hypothetical protein
MPGAATATATVVADVPDSGSSSRRAHGLRRAGESIR